MHTPPTRLFFITLLNGIRNPTKLTGIVVPLVAAAQYVLHGISTGRWTFVGQPIVYTLCFLVAYQAISAAHTVSVEIKGELAKDDRETIIWTPQGDRARVPAVKIARSIHRVMIYGYAFFIVGLCVLGSWRIWALTASSERREFVNSHHDHISIGRIDPHVNPTPDGTTVAQVDIEVINNLLPAKLFGTAGVVWVEPNNSEKSEQDVLVKSEQWFKNIGLGAPEQVIKLPPQDRTAFIAYGVINPDELDRLSKSEAVLYTLALVVFEDETGRYEQQMCRSTAIRKLPEGNTIHSEARCNQFNDEAARSKDIQHFR
jgi:hypothetical protein